MMTDEQAAFLAASSALQGSELARSVADRNSSTVELGDAITNLAGQIYTQMRQWNAGREHDDLQDRLATVTDRLHNR